MQFGDGLIRRHDQAYYGCYRLPGCSPKGAIRGWRRDENFEKQNAVNMRH
jgi:hypothetical protein